MPTVFCEHLDEYGAQYSRTEGSYLQCVSLLDRLMSDQPDTGLVASISTAIQEWAQEDAKLRDMLVAEVKAGRVRVPLALIRSQRTQLPHANRTAHHQGHLVCAACRFVLPRLEYPEWKIAHNGAASFRDRELPSLATV